MNKGYIGDPWYKKFNLGIFCVNDESPFDVKVL
jgi:hypothetical protein